jgi:glycosyltransferase involved in cell wall biosynthesis
MICMPSKPELLYLSPVVPALAGNGLAMRAGMVLEALAEHYSISLLVVSLYPPFAARVPAAFERLCLRTVVTTPARLARTRLGRARVSFLPAFFSGRFGRRPYHGSRFDVVHVFRLSMMPYARPFLSVSSGTPKGHLDLDDIESETHRRIAALCRLNKDGPRAAYYEMEARRHEALEEEVLRGFDRVYVCSEGDKARLHAGYGGDLCVLPNAVRLPDAARSDANEGAFTFLFVGTLGYYPNEDAVRYFGSEILPHIRRLTRSDFAVNIVGKGASPRLRRIAVDCGMQMIGEVPDIAPWYQNSTAVVAPVRAGGGTRIKVLEAFSHRRAVISTSIGIEGIDAIDDEHVLIANTPEAFAERCVRLMADRGLRDRLAENAFSLVSHRYSAEAMKRTIASLVVSSA